MKKGDIIEVNVADDFKGIYQVLGIDVRRGLNPLITCYQIISVDGYLVNLM